MKVSDSEVSEPKSEAKTKKVAFESETEEFK
jgi:hypothetical protein